MESLATALVSDRIASHLAAVHADEAMFDENGRPFDVVAAEETRKKEGEAFAHFVECRCSSEADVLAKVDYLVNGTVGERDRLIDILQDNSQVETFLKSLLLPRSPQKSASAFKGC